METIYRWGAGNITFQGGRLPIGGDYGSILPTPAPITIYSMSENDAVGLAGAQELLVEGIDVEGNRVVELVALQGQSPVRTVNNYYFLDRARVQSGGENMGAIIFERPDRKMLAKINTGENGLYKAEYHTGRQEALLLSVGVSVMATGRADPIKCTLASYEGGRRVALHSFYVDGHSSANKECSFADGLVIPPGVRLVLEAETESMNVPLTGWIFLRG